MLIPCCRLPDLFQVEQYTVTLLMLCYNLILTAEHIEKWYEFPNVFFFFRIAQSARYGYYVLYLSKMRCVVSLPKKFLKRCHVFK